MAFAGGSNAALACGTERWSIKVGSDPDVGVILNSPIRTSIEELSALPSTSALPEAQRIRPVETRTYRLINVKLLRISLERDQDYRLTIQDSDGKTMFVKSPDPACATGSRFLDQIRDVRAKVAALAMHIGNEPITVSGVGFFNFLSKTPNQAQNGIELHPLLSLCVGFDCSDASGIWPIGGPIRSASPRAPPAGEAVERPSARPSPLPREPSPAASKAPERTTMAAHASPTPAPTSTWPWEPEEDPGNQAGAGASITCNGYGRWPIKTMADANAHSVNLTPKDTTIVSLRAVPLPSPYPLPSEYPTRISPHEYTTYRLTNVILYEVFPPGTDQDYHVILEDSSGNLFTAEAPNPQCVAGTIVATQISAVRSYIDSHWPVGSSPIFPGATVTVTGVGFYDWYTGEEHAANGAELHPMLSISTSSGTPPPSPTPTPTPKPSPTGQQTSTPPPGSTYYYPSTTTAP
ncbi:MAG: hypothetical protein GIX00_11515, partial [Candidatus Eremiobacteraeota bacterium]|nr:hypothetical protein [Candidatus Eremiobacteraeota bacterium]MBC5809212.1 hypothetical protein [Candidatus Eremiobacteraeota bacterium]